MAKRPGNSAGLLRPLNRPRAAKVEAAENGEPTALLVAGRRIMVESVLETWRIDDEWWRERPVSRMYYRVLLEDGRVVDLYRAPGSGRPSASLRTGPSDSAGAGWYRQSY